MGPETHPTQFWAVSCSSGEESARKNGRGAGSRGRVSAYKPGQTASNGWRECRTGVKRGLDDRGKTVMSDRSRDEPGPGTATGRQGPSGETPAETCIWSSCPRVSGVPNTGLTFRG